MILTCTMNEQPARVEIDSLPEGGQYVRLHDNAHQVDVPSPDPDAPPSKAWECDEAAFTVPADRALTVEGVTADFSAWWSFGAAYDPDADSPTVDERLANLEAAMLALVGM